MQQPPNTNRQYPQFQQPQQQPNYTQPQTYYPPQQEWQQSVPLPPQQQQWQQPPYQPPEKPRNAFKLGLGIGCGIMSAFAIGIEIGNTGVFWPSELDCTTAVCYTACKPTNERTNTNDIQHW